MDNKPFSPKLASLDSSYKELKEQKQGTKNNAITINAFSQKLEWLNHQLQLIETADDSEPEERVIQANKLLTEARQLQAYSHDADRLADIMNQSGLTKLKETIDPTLFSIITRLNVIIGSMPASLKTPLSDEKRLRQLTKSLNTIVQKRKVSLAYANLTKGRKYKKAGVVLDKDKSVSAQNPISDLSKRNLKNLKQKLKTTLQQMIDSGKIDKMHLNGFGLLPEEIDLFAALLNLPYKLQHATNNFSKIARSGSMHSLTEIQRHNPNYESPFSTSGNLEELGNGGFVFFRCYVDGVNGDDTRYGDTRVISNLDLLRDIGWISLHDQLAPFSKKHRKQALYVGKRLLLMGVPGDINNKAKANKSKDGLTYTYRTQPLGNTNSGRKDTQKSFGDTIDTKSETISFTDEIFYGGDILPGIALSIIYRLRQLEQCGYRKIVLKQFAKNTALDNIIFLGQIIKNFYRIEGKYPARLPLQYQPHHQTCFFKPYANSNQQRRYPVDNALKIENPDGDGRLNLDLSFNDISSILGFFNDRFKENENKIFILNKKTDNPQAIAELAALKLEQTELEEKIKRAEFDKNQFIQKITIAVDDDDIDLGWLKKRSYEFLQLVAEKLSLLIEKSHIDVDTLTSCPLIRLSLLSAENFLDLIEADSVTWEQLQILSNNELDVFSSVNLSTAIDEYGFTFLSLLELHRNSPEKFEWATCDDFDDLILENVHTIPTEMIAFIQELGHDIDFTYIRDNCSEFENMLLDAALNSLPGNGDEGYDDDMNEEAWYANIHQP